MKQLLQLLLCILLMNGCALFETKPFVCSSTDETMCALEQSIDAAERKRASMKRKQTNTERKQASDDYDERVKNSGAFPKIGNSPCKFIHEEGCY